MVSRLQFHENMFQAGGYTEMTNSAYYQDVTSNDSHAIVAGTNTLLYLRISSTGNNKTSEAVIET